MQQKSVDLLFCKFTLMFRVSTTPIIRSIQNCNYSLRYCAATSLQRGQARPCWREKAAQKIWPVPEAVVTVLCTGDDGCGWHPKHVQWTCRVINRLFCVASRWTIINIFLISNFESLCNTYWLESCRSDFIYLFIFFNKVNMSAFS